MIRNEWFDEGFLRDWSNGPLLVRRDIGRFVRVIDLVSQPPNSDPEDLVAFCTIAKALIGYSPKRKSYRATEATPNLWASAELDTRDGGRVVCKTALSLYAELCDIYTPEFVEQTCWIPARQVDETARLIELKPRLLLRLDGNRPAYQCDPN